MHTTRQREMQIISEIRQTLLDDPLPVELHGFRAGAASVPTPWIGGDFYYFYKHGDQRIDMIVADVAGQGIRASLAGAATKARLLAALCHLLGESPADAPPEPKEIVALAHAALAERLIELQSPVALCYVRIDPNLRSCQFVDAGCARLIHFQAAAGRCERLHGDNLALGGRKGEIYDQHSVAIQADDLLVLYSHGVALARNSTGESFGEDRLRQYIESHGKLTPEELAQGVCEAALAFAAPAPPAGGLTCVVVQAAESERPRAHARLKLLSDFRELARAREFIRHFCRDLAAARLDDASIGKLELAVTEACSNIMKHAFPGRTDQPIQLEAEDFPDRLSIRLRHLGNPFDPSAARPRTADQQASGFGVRLIAQSVETVRYYRDERGRNCVALTKNR